MPSSKDNRLATNWIIRQLANKDTDETHAAIHSDTGTLEELKAKYAPLQEKLAKRKKELAKGGEYIDAFEFPPYLAFYFKVEGYVQMVDQYPGYDEEGFRGAYSLDESDLAWYRNGPRIVLKKWVGTPEEISESEKANAASHAVLKASYEEHQRTKSTKK